ILISILSPLIETLRRYISSITSRRPSGGRPCHGSANGEINLAPSSTLRTTRTAELREASGPHSRIAAFTGKPFPSSAFIKVTVSDLSRLARLQLAIGCSPTQDYYARANWRRLGSLSPTRF